MEKWQPLIDYLTKFMREELARQDHNATGALSNSLRVDVKEGDGESTIAGYGRHYGKYVNRGRKAGSMPPTNYILSWMRTRGIGADLQKDYQKRGLAFVIARSIAENGIPPIGGYSEFYAKGNTIDRTHFVDKLFDEHSDEIYSIIRRIVDDYLQMAKTEFINYWKHKKSQE